MSEFSPFSKLQKRTVEVNFNGGSISGDAGVLLLREVDKKSGLTKDLSKCFLDRRDQGKVRHTVLGMLRQRVFGIAQGYEDLNDHDSLRNCKGMQASVGSLTTLASSPTLCRFEKMADRSFAIQAHKIMVEQFISSFKTPPKELILDFDATDTQIHGDQEEGHYNGYYKHECFLPLYVFCEKFLLASYLRPSCKDQALHSGAILKLLVDRLRQKWPDVRIIFRADCGFWRTHTISWCERNNVEYIVGIGGNQNLYKQTVDTVEQLREEFGDSQEGKLRKFTEFQYAAKGWKCERKIIGKAEINRHETNQRFIATNIERYDPKHLYEKIYCMRGEMENRIKEQKLDLFSDRMSAHEWWANQFRILLSAFAYILINYIRQKFLKGTRFAKAQIGTIILKILKVGAIISANTRKIIFSLASGCPDQDIWNIIMNKMRLE